MSEELDVQETEDKDEVAVVVDDDKHAALRSLSTDELILIIENTRKEAGNHRKGKSEVQKKLEDDAKKWQEYMDAQKTEAQKLAEAKTALEDKILELEKDRLRDKIAREYDIDEELVEFIDGSDEREMRQRAEKLASKAVAPKNPLDLRPGMRGEPVVPKRSTGGNFLADLGRHL